MKFSNIALLSMPWKSKHTDARTLMGMGDDMEGAHSNELATGWALTGPGQCTRSLSRTFQGVPLVREDGMCGWTGDRQHQTVATAGDNRIDREASEGQTANNGDLIQTT
jgi:hypothetical protein